HGSVFAFSRLCQRAATTFTAEWRYVCSMNLGRLLSSGDSAASSMVTDAARKTFPRALKKARRETCKSGGDCKSPPLGKRIGPCGHLNYRRKPSGWSSPAVFPIPSALAARQICIISVYLYQFRKNVVWNDLQKHRPGSKKIHRRAVRRQELH